jgi:hypothetical protein
LIALFSCNKTKKPSPFLTSLKGTWVSGIDTAKNIPFRKLFIFEDSICITDNYRFSDRNYNINDSIISFQGLSDLRYKIIRLNSDSLILKRIMIDPEEPIIIPLFRLKKRNDLRPSKIYFYSTGCFGDCPGMYVEIDSNRNLRYNGKVLGDTSGGYMGKINEGLYQSLLQKIHYLPLDSLKPFYEVGVTDQQTAGVRIIAGDRIVSSGAYGEEKEPAELRLLLNYIMDLHKHVQFQRDSSFVYESLYSNREFRKLISSTSTPPPIYVPKRRHRK